MELRLDVEYYDSEEGLSFSLNYPKEFEKINSIVKAGFVKIPFADFKTYSQMHHRNSEFKKLASFESIHENIGDLYGNVNFYTNFDIESGRFYSEIPHNNEQNHVSESIGCGGILSVVGAIYDLTQADWQRIDIQGHKDFDFNSAVIEGFDKFIVVESKGSIVKDNSSKSQLSTHKKRIKDKKNDEGFKNAYSKGADLFIGGITAVDDINHAKVYLVDPPMNSDMPLPLKVKIKTLKRLTYYKDWISIITKRSYFTIALKNRIKVIEQMDNITPLKNLKLINSNDEPIIIDEDFAKTKSNIEGYIVGKFIIINDKKAVFIGLPIKVYQSIASQDFNAINSFKITSSIKVKKINVKVAKAVAVRSGFINRILLGTQEMRSDYVYFTVEDATVFQNSAGLNYSILTTKNIYSQQ